MHTRFPESFDCAEENLRLNRLFLIEPHIPCHHFLTHLCFDLIMLFLSSSNGLSVKKNIAPGVNDLQFTKDGWVKGSAIIFRLDTKGQFTKGEWLGGLRLSVARIPSSMKDHLLFFESRNQQRPSKGTMCAMIRSPLTFWSGEAWASIQYLLSWIGREGRFGSGYLLVGTRK